MNRGDEFLLWGIVLVWAARNILSPERASAAVREYLEPKSAPPGYRPDLPTPRNETRLETAQRVYDQVYDVAIRAGFPDARLATAVALAESGGNPGAEVNDAREHSVGLWQVNLRAHPRYTREQMLDPDANARAAVQISRSGTNWQPWSAYKSGRYLKFMRRPEASAQPQPTRTLRWLSLPRGAVTLEPGRVYRANIRLTGMEATFGDKDDVASKLQEKAGPLKPLKVRELQPSLYEAVGTFAGSAPRNVTWPEQVTAAWVQER